MKIFSIIAIFLALISCSEKDDIDKENSQETQVELKNQNAEQGEAKSEAKSDANLDKDDLSEDGIDKDSASSKPAAGPQGADEPAAASQDEGSKPASAPFENQGAKDISDHDAIDNKEDLLKISSDDIVMGNKDASVTLIEYSSPSCPHCAYYHENIFTKIKKEYIDTGKIAYVLRYFIWTKQDLDGAILSLCDKEKFVPFTNILYSRQNSWAFDKNYREILTNIAQLGGVSPEQYANCLNDEAITEKLLMQTKLFGEKMKTDNIAGTPAFIINGQVISQSHSFKNISAEIDKILINKGSEVK